MSKERELLKECRLMLDNPINGTAGRNLQIKITELILAQPESFMFKDRQLTGSLISHDDMYKRGYAQAEFDLKREPLSEATINYYLERLGSHFKWDDGFEAGVKWAEKAHGIGGE